MSQAKMKLFVWEGVLTDWTSGMMIAIAPTADEAREALLKECDYLPLEDLAQEPEEHDLTKNVAYYVWGGG